MPSESMAMEERQGVNLFFVPMKDIDLQKAYEVGKEASDKTSSIFNGVNVFTFAGNPPTYKQSVNVFTDPKHIDEVVEAIEKGLGLTRADYIIQALPATQFVPRGRPPQTAG